VEAISETEDAVIAVAENIRRLKMTPKVIKRIAIELIAFKRDYNDNTRYGFGPVWDWDGASLSFGWQFGKWIVAIDIEVREV